jgi:hypothetical protein
VTVLSPSIYLLYFKYLLQLENHSNTRITFQHDTILKGWQIIPKLLVAPSVIPNKYFGRLHQQEQDVLSMKNVRVGRQLNNSFRWENIKKNKQQENFCVNGKVLFKRIFMK